MSYWPQAYIDLLYIEGKDPCLLEQCTRAVAAKGRPQDPGMVGTG